MKGLCKNQEALAFGNFHLKDWYTNPKTLLSFHKLYLAEEKIQ